MASEPSNLRHLFGETPTPSIDVSSVIRRSRARRAPRLLGAGAIAVLAVGGIAYGGFSGLAGLDGASTASDSGGAAPMSESSTSSEKDAQTQYSVGDECGGPVTDLAPGAVSAELAVSDESTAAVVTLTNTGATDIVGVGTGPTVTLTRDGTVVGRSDPAVLDFDLEHGESEDYDVELGVWCSAELQSGQVEARVTFQLPDGSVVGASQRVTLG